MRGSLCWGPDDDREIDVLRSAEPNGILLVLTETPIRGGPEHGALGGHSVQVAAQFSGCVRKAAFNGQGLWRRNMAPCFCGSKVPAKTGGPTSAARRSNLAAKTVTAIAVES